MENRKVEQPKPGSDDQKGSDDQYDFLNYFSYYPGVFGVSTSVTTNESQKNEKVQQSNAHSEVEKGSQIQFSLSVYFSNIFAAITKDIFVNESEKNDRTNQNLGTKLVR